MTAPLDRSNYPFWVKLSLWGLSSRAAVWFFVWLCVALAAGAFVYGFTDRRGFWVAPLALAAAVPYRLAIRWIDRHGEWRE